MRYLDKLLGEAETKKSPFKTIQKIKRTKEKLTGRSMDAEDARDAAFDRGDDKEAYKQGDKHHNAMERSAKLSVFADKVGKKAHLKGGGKGDGKPRGKLRLVQSAFYQQVGHLIAEITYSRRDARILKGRQELKDAEKLDKAASAAIASKERDKLPDEKEWTGKLKAKKILTNKKKQINARRETTREKSE